MSYQTIASHWGDSSKRKLSFRRLKLWADPNTGKLNNAPLFLQNMCFFSLFGLGKEDSWSCCSNLGISLNWFFFLLCFRLIYEDVPVFPTMERFFLANTWKCCCQICYRLSDWLSFSNRLRGLFECSVFLHAFTVNRCICNCRCNAAVVVCTINDVWDPYNVLTLRSNWTEFITNSFDFFFLRFQLVKLTCPSFWSQAVSICQRIPSAVSSVLVAMRQLLLSALKMTED